MHVFTVGLTGSLLVGEKAVDSHQPNSDLILAQQCQGYTTAIHYLMFEFDTQCSRLLLVVLRPKLPTMHC
jgi:hypothetical protein